MPQFSFTGSVETDARGLQQLANFYETCKKYSNCCVTIIMANVQFFDANLSSIFLSLAGKLKKENNLRFFIDYKVFNSSSLGVLRRNGLAGQLCNMQGQVFDNRETVIPVRSFNMDDADGFIEYIDRDLFRHRGLENIPHEKKKKLRESYSEIFDNVGIHANTQYPICVCGQYYPQLKELKFTLVDLGEGFLKKIKEFTAGLEKPVKVAPQAISWALRGGSTKPDAPGGNGLKNILKYCQTNNGALHIFSDGSYCVFDGVPTSHVIKLPLVGSTVSLIFRNL